MKSYGCYDVRKHIKIRNGLQYITLDIYLDLYGLYKRGLTSSVSRNYVVRSVKGMTKFLTLRTRRRTNKKHNARTDNIEVVPQYLMKILEEFQDIYTSSSIQEETSEK